jgi:hypothetical protein
MTNSSNITAILISSSVFAMCFWHKINSLLHLSPITHKSLEKPMRLKNSEVKIWRPIMHIKLEHNEKIEIQPTNLIYSEVKIW